MVVYSYKCKPRRPWNKRPDSRRVSKHRLVVEWAWIFEEVKTRLARVQVDKPMSTENLELKGWTKETGTKDATSYQIIEEGEETARVGEVWRLNPSRYLKWYWVKTKGELEIGLSSVHVTVWVCWFTDNCRKPAEQKEKGELKPLELQNAEELILSFREFSPKCMQQRSAIEKAQGNLKR